VKDVVTDPGDSWNATDDAMLAVLEDHPDDPVMRELTAFIGALSEDEQIWSRLRGSGAAMARSTTGTTSVARLRGHTIKGPPPIS
jgi:hypothetical protein